MFAVVTYHATDVFYDYNPIENNARFYYYPPHPDGFYYVPYAWIDGIVRGGYEYAGWENLVMSRYEVESPLAIELDGTFTPSTREGNLTITITAYQQIFHADLYLRMALTEDSLYYQGTNGVLWHNTTMRDMIPDTLGTPVSIGNGETVEFEQDFNCPTGLNPHFCRLVVWVQADDDREILQATKIDIEDLQETGIDEDKPVPRAFCLEQNYPNPFNTRTAISYSLAEPSEVKLEIYDLLGHKVSTLVDCWQSAGNHEAAWDASKQASGIYIYRLKANNHSEARKMVLLK